MFGLTNENCVWRIGTNQELQTMYSDISLILDIKIRRLYWVGYVNRMYSNKIIKIDFYNIKPYKSREKI